MPFYNDPTRRNIRDGSRRIPTTSGGSLVRNRPPMNTAPRQRPTPIGGGSSSSPPSPGRSAASSLSTGSAFGGPMRNWPAASRTASPTQRSSNAGRQPTRPPYSPPRTISPGYSRPKAYPDADEVVRFWPQDPAPAIIQDPYPNGREPIYKWWPTPPHPGPEYKWRPIPPHLGPEYEWRPIPRTQPVDLRPIPLDRPDRLSLLRLLFGLR